MKKLSLTFLTVLVLTSNLVFSQLDDLYHARIFNKCELTYEDNTVVNGYIAFFLEKKLIEDEDVYDSLERMFNYDDNDFEFKTSLNSAIKNLSQKNLKKIKVYYEGKITKTFKLMYIKNLSKDGKLISSSKKAWLPVIKDSLISLYQFNVYDDFRKYNKKLDEYISKKIKISFSVTYLSNNNQDYAFEIYNSEYGRLSNPNLDDSYLGKVLNYIFQDCPVFLNNIMKNNRWDYQPFIDKSIDYSNKIREIKNSKLNNFEKFNKLDQIYTQRDSQPFIKLIEQYNINCK